MNKFAAAFLGSVALAIAVSLPGRGDVMVDGVALSDGATGRGWAFHNGSLTLRDASGTTLSGVATNGEVRISVEATSEIAISNLLVSVPVNGGCALSITKDAELRIIASGTNSFASGPDRAGIEVPPSASLRVFGADAESGEESRAFVEVRGGASAAGIGGFGGFGDGGACGEVAAAGNVTLHASGGSNGAGIGGGWGGNGGAVSARTGARIHAFGGWNAPGIGGGHDGKPGSLAVSGARVEATGGSSAPGIESTIQLCGGFIRARAGKGGSSTPDLRLPPDDLQGLVVSAGTLAATPALVVGHACRPDDTPLSPVEIPLGTNAIEALAEAAQIDLSGAEKDEFGNIVAWLPPAITSLTIGGEVFTIRETPPPTGITVNGVDAATGGGAGWSWTDGTLLLSGPGPFSLSGHSDDGRVRPVIAAESSVVILDGLEIDASNTDFPALRVASGTDADIFMRGTNTLMSGKGCAGIQVETDAAASFASASEFGQGSDCTDVIFAFGGRQGAGIGGGVRRSAGEIKIFSGEIHAIGGTEGAGIGGGSWGEGASFEMEGGYVSAVAGADAAGIGGGKFCPAGSFKMCGGTAIAVGDDEVAAVGPGRNSPKAATGDFEITGGNLVAGHGKVIPAPRRDGDVYITRTGKHFQRVVAWRAAAHTGLTNTVVEVTGLEDYGTRDIRTSPTGELVFWLPTGEHEFTLDNGQSFATHVGPDVEGPAEFQPSTGIKIDGVDAATGGGFAWNWNGNDIEFNGPGPFLVSGVANGETALVVPNGNRTEIAISNLVVCAPEGKPALSLKPGSRTTIVMHGDNSLTGGDGTGAVELGDKARLKVARGRKGSTLALQPGAQADTAVVPDETGALGEITTGRGVESLPDAISPNTHKILFRN